MTHAIHRYEIPVDGSWHTIRLTGPIVHVATRTLNLVNLDDKPHCTFDADEEASGV